MPEKTVIILGAGFSAAAGVPTQGALLGKVLQGYGGDELAPFIADVFGLNRREAESLALEDVYTAIHKSVAQGQSIKGYSSDELKRLEALLTQRISHAINIDIDPELDANGYLGKFIRLLQEGATTNAYGVISLNWDILLDRRLGEERHGREKVFVDYGTHCTGLGNPDNRVKPALLAKRDREPVIPLLKLHGSLNWLVCPQCERLYVNWDRKIALEPHQCRACHPQSADLHASIILPTFQKALDTFHYQHIWNQGARVLSRTEKIVFIGYSFPLADFDFRALITKSLPIDTQVEVVLHESDERNGTGKRYEDYFGKGRCVISYDGVESYVDALTEQTTNTP